MLFDVFCPYCQEEQDTVDWTECWKNDGDQFEEECGSCSKPFNVTANFRLDYDVEEIEEVASVNDVKCECCNCGAKFLESEMKRIEVDPIESKLACPECDCLEFYIINGDGEDEK